MEHELQELQKFFYRGACSGFPIAGFYTEIEPGRYKIKYTDHEYMGLEYTDTYNVYGDGDFSVGETVLFDGDKRIWVMQYGGYYEAEAISCLKAVLRETYQNPYLFYGGRGVPVRLYGDYLYYNKPEEGSDFRHFRGKEEIFHMVTRKSVGYHTYQGWFLG